MLMRGDGEDVILPRRCGVCVSPTAMATCIMQLALTATILELQASDLAFSQASDVIPLATLSACRGPG